MPPKVSPKAKASGRNRERWLASVLPGLLAQLQSSGLPSETESEEEGATADGWEEVAPEQESQPSTPAEPAAPPPPPPPAAGCASSSDRTCGMDAHRGYKQNARSNQYAIWTVCSNCGERSSYTNLVGKQPTWTNLNKPPPPPTWKQLNPGGRGPLRHPPEPRTPGHSLTVLCWGKHKGMTYVEAKEKDPGYCFWVESRMDGECSEELRRFGLWLRSQRLKPPPPPRGKATTPAAKPRAPPKTPPPQRGNEHLIKMLLEALGAMMNSNESGEEPTSGTKEAEQTSEAEEQTEPEEAFPDNQPENQEDEHMAEEARTLTAQLQSILQDLVSHPAANTETMELASALMNHVLGQDTEKEGS